MRDKARITIREPNGVERSRPLSSRGLTVGRGADNNVALAYDSISRNHLQITFESGQYYVADLNSANGTFLGTKRLPPNQPVAWDPRQELRVGDVVISLEYAYTRAISSASDEGGETIVGNVDHFFPPDTEKHRRRTCLLLLGVVASVAICAVLATVIYLFVFS
jgi:predicted component of type VI protein secretion system